MQTTNRTVEVNNPTAILLNEEGVFEVTSPQGNVFEVTCRRGFKMSFREISETKCKRPADCMVWRIRRLDRLAK